MVSDQRQLDDGMLSVAEIAAAFSCSAETVRRLIAAGDLEAIDVAPTGSKKRIIRIWRRSYEQLIEHRRILPDTRPNVTPTRRVSRPATNHLGLQ